jgi:hypothetical protein
MSITDVVKKILDKDAWKTAVVNDFDKSNDRIRDYSASYDAAAKMAENYDAEKVRGYVQAMKQQGFEGDPEQLLKSIIENQTREIAGKLQGKDLLVEVVMTYTGNGHVELVTPIRANGTKLEKDLASHIVGVAKELDVASRTGRVGKYLAVAAEPRDVHELSMKLTDLPQQFKLANVRLEVAQFALPELGTYQNLNRSVIRKATLSYGKYNLFTTFQSDGDFWPDRDVPFTVHTPAGAVECHRTSGDGVYVIGDNKGLEKAYKKMNLQIGDRIEITEIVKHKEYEMKKVKK